jgi:hypothetical protein
MLNKSKFHSTESDSYTASTMRRMKSGDSGPNSSPSINLQRSSPGGSSRSGASGNTPNSVASDLNSGRDYGQKLVTRYPEVPAVTPLRGIPARDPMSGGASELQKGSENYGFTSRRS